MQSRLPLDAIVDQTSPVRGAILIGLPPDISLLSVTTFILTDASWRLNSALLLLGGLLNLALRRRAAGLRRPPALLSHEEVNSKSLHANSVW